MEISSSISRRARCFTVGLFIWAGRSQLRRCGEGQKKLTRLHLHPLPLDTRYRGHLNLVEGTFKVVVIEVPLRYCDKRDGHTSRLPQSNPIATQTRSTTTTTKWVSKVLQVSSPSMRLPQFRYSSSIALPLLRRGRRSRRSTRNIKSTRCLGGKSLSTRPCPFISSLLR